MQEDGWELEFVKMQYHKEEQLNIGTETCYVKHCWSTRPAYVLAATKDNKTTELMYVYEPMGLYRQYEVQGSILARFQNVQLALCFLKVASTELGVKYMDRACTVAMADQEASSEAQENILKEWRSAIDSFAIEACEFSVQQEITDLPRVRSWASMLSVLGVLAPRVCDKYLDWMTTREEKSSQ